ncbi:bimC [Cyberlindnera jadinii]|uniref:Kinesin-like protein n=1 Tax=Cyberlindnera jadinii (strain ATCC 18201 / CBS 1600 / BCRC 20928 / JCM 3617 / NBRC 0987 / NRRL Y-1542) TaxID=983966 RepID=A0A0H5C2I5_CYBJN|nr:kinesin-domain-containing protein [Cyberlindnera jadinii NRRL Y-1542]ODV72827.1 kinesin-domain-containing protein [Cyberlindnera jadinii NRRL Y-1542]CEP22155.1 bimC [Cyberlindnera jadinii]
MSENENIQVVVRCRARNAKETSTKSAVVVHVADELGDGVVLNPSDETGVAAQLNSKKYVFDKVFGPMADQTSLFANVASPLFDEFLKGYNCTLLVYGMTSTGKTYTMSGDNSIVNGQLSERAGIIPRMLIRLFEVLQDANGVVHEDYMVKCSFVELYNEELKDLLSEDPKKKIRIFDQKQSMTNEPTLGQMNKSTIHIQNLEEVILRNANHGLKVLESGLKIRQVAATKMNDFSSRSHTIFTLNLFKKDQQSGELFRISKMNLVDLAGSENISRSGALNQRAKEAGSINQSLLTLGRVISLLVEKNNQHIPYRESKLTRLLQDSLGGRTKTCLIATISPAKINYDETLSTLEYANKAKSIQNKPQIGSTLSKDVLLRELSLELSKTKADLTSTRLKDGIYMDNDNYEELMSDIQEYKTELEEYKRSQDTLKKHNDQLKSQLQDTENQSNTYITMINTLNATVETLHNKIDQQRENEKNLMSSSSKFKNIINSINENLAVFKKYEDDTKTTINNVNKRVTEDLIQRIVGILSNTNKDIDISPNIASISEEISEMITVLQRSTYDACKNVGETILSKFPDLFKDFDSNVSQLGNLLKEFQLGLNEQFSNLSKENNDFKAVLNDSLFQNHADIVNSVVSKTQKQLEDDANQLLNEFIEVMREKNNKQQELVAEKIRLAVSESLQAEKDVLVPAKERWENASRQIINSCDSRTLDFQFQHKHELSEISTRLKETSRFTNLSKTTIDNELKNINQVTTDFLNNGAVQQSLDDIKCKFSMLGDQKDELREVLDHSKDGFVSIQDELQRKIVDNTTVDSLEEQDVDTLIGDLEQEQKNIRHSLLPTGKTPKRQALYIPKKKVSDSSQEAPPKFELIGERFQNRENKENNANEPIMRKRKSDEEITPRHTKRPVNRYMRSLPDYGRIPRR